MLVERYEEFMTEEVPEGYDIALRINKAALPKRQRIRRAMTEEEKEEAKAANVIIME